MCFREKRGAAWLSTYQIDRVMRATLSVAGYGRWLLGRTVSFCTVTPLEQTDASGQPPAQLRGG
jgi:hypothetical protein